MQLQYLIFSICDAKYVVGSTLRYLQLQASLSSRGIGDYLFFNTYFYKKLQEAVSCKVPSFIDTNYSISTSL